jgi:hypothetical protein
VAADDPVDHFFVVEYLIVAQLLNLVELLDVFDAVDLLMDLLFDDVQLVLVITRLIVVV